MPGLNKKGPDGSGPMSGKQQGMCRRTDELSLKGRRDGQGRGMGGRCRGSFFQESSSAGPTAEANVNENEQVNADELSTLKTAYRKAQVTLETLMQKIDVIEGKKTEPPKDKKDEA